MTAICDGCGIVFDPSLEGQYSNGKILCWKCALKKPKKKVSNPRKKLF